MSNEYVTVRNKVTRKVGLVRRRIAEHGVFGRNLEIVPDGTKSFVSWDELTRKSRTTSVEPSPIEDFENEDENPETEEA